MPNSTLKGLKQLEEFTKDQKEIGKLYLACKNSKDTNSKACQQYNFGISRSDYVKTVLSSLRCKSEKAVFNRLSN